MIVHRPDSEAQVSDLVMQALADKSSFSIQGGGTRAPLGRPAQTQSIISTARLSGIALYEPAEMVMTVRAGTPLAHFEALLAEHNQMLPFEPMDHRALFGTQGEPTIGGVFAGNISGPARINRGACRDAAIGVRLVNGRGEIIKSGGRVMKNVTGLDLTKLTCGAFGTLGLVTEISFKVLPKPEASATLELSGLSDQSAGQAMALALTSPFDPDGVAHLPASIAGEHARTLIRISNFKSSVDYRLAALEKILHAFGKARRIDGAESAALWQAIRDVAFFAAPDERAIWRVSTAPSRGPDVVARFNAAIPDARHFYDWGGGLVWIAAPPRVDAGDAALRAALAQFGGHATLIRAPDSLRASLNVFHPLGPVKQRISAGLKASFDPAALFEPGRMYAGI